MTLPCPGVGGGGGGNGEPGQSAYEIAVENGFVGTEAEWLDSLVGPQGEQGDDGPQGIQGVQGNPGTPAPAREILILHDKTTGEMTVGTWFKRVLDTIIYNSITGASLTSGVLSLPAGTYMIHAQASSIRSNATALRFRNTATPVTLAKGMATWSGNASGTGVGCWSQPTISGVFVLAAPATTLELQQWTATASASFGDSGNLGNIGSDGATTSAEVTIEKLA